MAKLLNYQARSVTRPPVASPAVATSNKMSARACYMYLALGILVMFVYFANLRAAWLPAWAPRYPLYILLNASAVVAIIIGILRWRPNRVMPWYLMAIGQASYTVGDFLFYRARYITHSNSFPSLADIFYLGRVPFMVAGLALIIRYRSRHDRAAVIDSLIFGAAIALLSWIFLMKPYAVGTIGLSVRITSIAYPITDLMLLVLALRLITGGGRQSASFRFLTAGLILLAGTDSYYGWLNLHGVAYQSGSPVEAGWLLYYLMVGACALHPSMRNLTVSAPIERSLRPRARLGFLSVATFVGPTLLIIEAALGRPVDAVPIGIASICVIGLVIFRLAVVMHDEELAQAQIRHQALHDPLTALANRALILDRIEQMLARSRRSNLPCAVMFLDLDNFKDINDTLGHQVGDELLVAVGARLVSALRGVDTVGRLGGDEFILLLEDAAFPAGVAETADRILDVLRAPFELIGGDFPLSISASIGTANGERVAPGELLRDADIALYQAKAAGKNCAVAFAPSMQAAVDDHRYLDEDLHGALAENQFYLLYQPTIDLQTNTFTGVEALLRWKHPDRGVVQPDEFIPALEASGLIVSVGAWVLEEACRQGAVWQAAGHRFSVSVNVSSRQLDRDRIFDDVQSALTVSGFDPALLVLEVAETALMEDVEAAIVRLGSLKSLGVRIAIDDFGTGYSSIAYLRRLPIDVLKIDRSFVSSIADSAESAALVRTLVQLGKVL
ncbi:MAG: diguanylate cyclase/phosphodiesterase with sensor(s), partial [Acidimicrobiaceae bacterium]|nr:diguanylate cyclase/phosphodiesterase with sensor(s) [Acidimicrobiaceae bacterium]